MCRKPSEQSLGGLPFYARNVFTIVADGHDAWKGGVRESAWR
jgi:hypothetical protein